MTISLCPFDNLLQQLVTFIDGNGIDSIHSLGRERLQRWSSSPFLFGTEDDKIVADKFFIIEIFFLYRLSLYHLKASQVYFV